MKVSTLWKHLIHFYEHIYGMWVSLFVLPGINPRASVTLLHPKSTLFHFWYSVECNSFSWQDFCLSFCPFQLCYQSSTVQKYLYFFSHLYFCGFYYVKGKSMFLGGNIWFTFSCEDLISSRNILAYRRLKPPVAESSFPFSNNNSLFKRIIRIVSRCAFKHWKYNP